MFRAARMACRPFSVEKLMAKVELYYDVKWSIKTLKFKARTVAIYWLSLIFISGRTLFSTHQPPPTKYCRILHHIS